MQRPQQVSRPVGASTAASGSAEAASGREADLRLAARAAACETGAFAQFHARFDEPMRGFVRNRLRSADAAEIDDVVQEVFLAAFRSLESYEGRSSLLVWMFGIAYHMVHRHLRARRRAGPSIEPSAAVEVRDPHPGADRQVDCSRLLAQCSEVARRDLTPDQQEVFARYYGGGESLGAVARELGRSTDSVKTILSRARRRLARALPELREVLQG